MNDSNSLHTDDIPPVVVIAGRPNVGKSTLFNRLVGRRRAITDPTPGVTRDPVEGIWDVDGRRVRLVDTGGYKVEGGEMDRLVTERSLRHAHEADVILLMLDVTEQTPEDQAFIETLRPFADRIIVVVNKVDNEKRGHDVWDFHSFGFPRVVGISAAHGGGMDALYDSVRELLPEKGSGEMQDESSPDIRISILGKPNTGKSTLLNRLTGSEKSLVTEIPGTTRDVVEARFLHRRHSFLILDTAGMRRKSKVTDSVEYYSVNRAVKSIEDADIIFLVIDVTEGLSDQDKKIAQLAVRKGKGIIIVLNKWDLIEDIGNRRNAETDRVRFLFPILEFAPIVFISAGTGMGIESLLDVAERVWKQLNRSIDTPALNKLLKDSKEFHRPPGKMHYKPKYITQTGTNPVRFVLFVNRKKGFPDGWVGFLRNQVRREFGLTEIPILIELRE